MGVKGVAAFKREIDHGRYANLLHAERAIGRWPNPSRRRKLEVLAYAKKVLKDTRPEKTRAKKAKSKPSPNSGDRVRYVKALLELRVKCESILTDLLEGATAQGLDLSEVLEDWEATDQHLPSHPDLPDS